MKKSSQKPLKNNDNHISNSSENPLKRNGFCRFSRLFGIMVLPFLLSGCSFFDHIRGLDQLLGSSSTISDSQGTSSSEEISTENSSFSSEDFSSAAGSVESSFDPISFHFLTLQTSSQTLYNGDAIFIKAGDNDILIDAGSRVSSAPSLKRQINQYCADGKLEYVFATHAHQDHIAAFGGTSKANKGLLYEYKVDTLIDFDLTNNVNPDNPKITPTTTYTNYIAARNYAVENGATRYSALDCVNEKNGAKKQFDLGKGLSVEVLYQKYYETRTDNENNYSVSLLFKQGEKKMLFTGDLEDDGCDSLLEHNAIGHVDLFKGGHHGSINANADSFLKAITPSTICTCCVAGSNEYTSNNSNTMPYQATIDNWAKYTDEVYLTSYAASTGEASKIGEGGDLNGEITVNYDESGNKSISGSNNSLKLKDTEWMKNNRVMPTEWKS